MRTRFHLITVCILGALLVSAPVSAAESRLGTPPSGSEKIAAVSHCKIGLGLGSTLLFPYFEVDLEDPNGVKTLISVNNGCCGATMARLVMWTDWGVPTLAFDIYLGDFDIQTISVRSLFDGFVPSTGEGANLTSYPWCSGFPPFHGNPVLTAGQIEHLRTAHTGEPNHIDGLCYGADHGDHIARGYITVDVVDQCGGVEGYQPQITPANTGTLPYFIDGGGSGGVGVIANNLWGDVFFVDSNKNSAQGTEAVALWADAAHFPGTFLYTFYGRFSGFDGRDDRVPLPGAWTQRYLNGGPFAGGADLIVFRNPNTPASTPVTCGSVPPWYPLTADTFSKDEEGGNTEIHDDDAFPLMTQRVSVESLGPASDFGFVNIAGDGEQLWVQPVLEGLGRYSAGLNGAPVSFLCGTSPPPP